METPRAPRRDVLDHLRIPLTAAGDDPRDASEVAARRLSVVCRLALVPVLVLAGALAGDVSPWFSALIAVLVLWLGVSAVLAFGAHARHRLVGGAVVADLVVLGGLVATTGGVGSPLRWVIIAFPVLAGFVHGTRTTAAATLAVSLTYAVPALPDVVAREPEALDVTVLITLAIHLSGVAGVAIAYGRERLTRLAAAADRGRRRLMTGALDAEDSERRRVSQDLHGEALQVLLAAAQDADEGAGDREALRRAREGVRSGVALLRDTVRDLHPAAMRHVGLEAALAAALEHRVRGVVLVEVLPGAEHTREPMLLAVVRDLGDALATIVPDSAVAAQVTRDGACVQLALSADSDERGLEAHRIALARCSERVQADGGHIEVRPGPDRRTLITIRLPVDPSAALGSGTEHSVDEEEAERVGQIALAALLLLAAPAVWAYALLCGQAGTGFAVLAGLGTTAHLAALAFTASPWWRRYPGTLIALGDAVGFSLLVAAQGGIATELPALAVAFPFCLVLTLAPRRALAVCATLCVALTAVALPDVLTGDRTALRTWLVVLAALLWATAASNLLGAGRQRMRVRLAELEQARRRLLHDSLDAADAERRRLSERLHDGALQALMTAGQDLDDALAGDRRALERAGVELREGLQLLRDIVAELHPPALEHGGLRPAVSAIVERSRERAGFAARVDVDPRADGLLDGLLVALVRELLVNVAKHAEADSVSVTIVRMGDDILLEVADDGVGIDPGRRAAAMAAGHIGLASARERVESEGGSMQLTTGNGRGTRVQITVPAPVAALW